MGRPAVDGRRKRGEQDGKKEKAELGGRADAGHPAGNGALVGKSARQRIRTPLEGVRQLSEGWYRLGGRPSGGGPDTGTVTLDSGEALTLYYDGLNPTDAGLVLTTRGAVYRLRVDLGEESLYAYDDSTFRRNEQMRAKLDCDVVLPEETGGNP